LRWPANGVTERPGVELLGNFLALIIEPSKLPLLLASDHRGGTRHVRPAAATRPVEAVVYADETGLVRARAR
jgi:hypothetical protein